MQAPLEKLWNDYFADECAVIDTEEEKAMAKKAVEIHEAASKSLTKEQIDEIEKYVDVLCEIQYSLVKKAFFKGCEFCAAFLFEMGLGEA